MSRSVGCAVFRCDLNVNTLLLLRFQSTKYNRQVLISDNVDVEIINFFLNYLNYFISIATYQDIGRILGIILELALDFIQPIDNTNNTKRNEKMVIMYTDFSVNLGASLPTMVEELSHHDIILIVIAIRTPAREIWDQHRTLVRSTGGEYMLLQNALAVLERVILLVLRGEDTLRQAFYHMSSVNNPLVPNNIGEMNGQNEATDGVGDLAFDHGLSE